MLSVDNIKVLRKRYKIEYRKHLFSIFNDNNFQLEWNKRFEEYNIDIIQNKHHLEVTNILSYAFSASSGSILSRIFERSTETEFIMLQPIVDHVIKTGTSFVILDKNKYVCAIYYFLDYVEMKLVKYDKSRKYTDRELKSIRMHRKLKRLYKYPKREEIKYGKYIYSAGVAVRPDVMGEGLFSLTHSINFGIAAAMGYKQLCMTTLHSRSRHRNMESKMKIGHYIYEQSLAEYTFKDGTTINDILDDIESKYGWDNIDEYRNAKIAIIIFDFESIRKYYNVSKNKIAITYWRDEYQNHLRLKLQKGKL
eukprot:251898_1